MLFSWLLLLLLCVSDIRVPLFANRYNIDLIRNIPFLFSSFEIAYSLQREIYQDTLSSLNWDIFRQQQAASQILYIHGEKIEERYYGIFSLRLVPRSITITVCQQIKLQLENMCIDKHSRHDGRDTAADNAQQSGQFPQICCTQWEKTQLKSY